MATSGVGQGWQGRGGRGEGGDEGEEGDVVEEYSVNSHVFVTNNTNKDSIDKILHNVGSNYKFLNYRELVKNQVKLQRPLE